MAIAGAARSYRWGLRWLQAGLLDVFQDAVEFVEVVVADDQLS